MGSTLEAVTAGDSFCAIARGVTRADRAAANGVKPVLCAERFV